MCTTAAAINGANGSAPRDRETFYKGNHVTSYFIVPLAGIHTHTYIHMHIQIYRLYTICVWCVSASVCVHFALERWQLPRANLVNKTEIDIKRIKGNSGVYHKQTVKLRQMALGWVSRAHTHKQMEFGVVKAEE